MVSSTSPFEGEELPRQGRRQILERQPEVDASVANGRVGRGLRRVAQRDGVDQLLGQRRVGVGLLVVELLGVLREVAANLQQLPGEGAQGEGGRDRVPSAEPPRDPRVTQRPQLGGQ